MSDPIELATNRNLIAPANGRLWAFAGAIYRLREVEGDWKIIASVSHKPEVLSNP